MVDDLMNIASNGTCIPIVGDEVLRGFDLQERDKWDGYFALRRLAKGGC